MPREGNLLSDVHREPPLYQMGKHICNRSCLASIMPQEFSQVEKTGELDRRVTQFTLTLSSETEIELRSGNYFWALVARHHI